MERPSRHRVRLKEYDYSQPGAYFVTICSYNREHLFASINALDSSAPSGVGQGLCSCRLSSIGSIINDEINALSIRYPCISVDNYVIMPNHVHLLLIISAEKELARHEQSPCPTVGDAICALKSISTKRANKMDAAPERKIWQFRFHDHIIRNEEEYRKIYEYIDDNPQKWEEDCYY